MRAKLKLVTILEAHYGIVSTAKLASTFGNGLEDWPNICRRGCNHTEYVSAPCLVSERLGQVAGLRLHLVEQPYVLDGDRCLVRKSGGQCDLLVGERTRLRARHDDDTDRYPFAQQWDGEDSAKIAQPLRLIEGVVGVCLNVGNVNHD